MYKIDDSIAIAIKGDQETPKKSSASQSQLLSNSTGDIPQEEKPLTDCVTSTESDSVKNNNNNNNKNKSNSAESAGAGSISKKRHCKNPSISLINMASEGESDNFGKSSADEKTNFSGDEEEEEEEDSEYDAGRNLIDGVNDKLTVSENDESSSTTSFHSSPQSQSSNEEDSIFYPKSPTPRKNKIKKINEDYAINKKLEAAEHRFISRNLTLASDDKNSQNKKEPNAKENQKLYEYDCRYNPADYEKLKVPAEIKELFSFITKYSPPPQTTNIDVKLKPFIPEYYASVGDIDAFIKVIDKEIGNDSLGIKTLDEPSAFQSDPSVLDLRLRALAKQSSAKAITVKKVENVGKNGKIIENWITDISDLHKSKPSPSVHYSKPMPDINHLLQEWSPEYEAILKENSLPSPDLDCDLKTYVDIVCNILDIPVYKSRIQSLHLLATLYSTQKYMNQYGPLGPMGMGPEELNMNMTMISNSVRMEDADRLEL